MAVMSLIQTLMYGSNVFNSDPYVWQYVFNSDPVMSLIQTLMYGSNVFNSDPYVWQECL